METSGLEQQVFVVKEGSLSKFDHGGMTHARADSSVGETCLDADHTFPFQEAVATIFRHTFTARIKDRGVEAGCYCRRVKKIGQSHVLRLQLPLTRHFRTS